MRETHFYELDVQVKGLSTLEESLVSLVTILLPLSSCELSSNTVRVTCRSIALAGAAGHQSACTVQQLP